MNTPLYQAAQKLFDLAIARGIMIATAESCTGGMVSMAITDIPGSSEVLDRSFITYSNASKTEMLGIPERLIAEEGAVAASVAAAMAQGALNASKADIAVGITGIAGPIGSTDSKPIGLVYIAAVTRDGHMDSSEFRFGNIGRGAVREQTSIEALNMMSKLIDVPLTA